MYLQGSYSSSVPGKLGTNNAVRVIRVQSRPSVSECRVVLYLGTALLLVMGYFFFGSFN